MAGLEAQLRITAKDEAGTALDLIKKQIGALDKQIGTFDRMASAVAKIAPATDPVIRSIGAATKALTEQRAAVTELAEGLGGMEGSLSAAAVGQERLAEVTAATTRVMMAQGVEAVRVSEKIVAAQRWQGAHAREAQRGLLGGLAPLAGPALAYGSLKALEAGASLEQMKFRLRAVSGADKSEAPFAEGLAAEIAAKYPAITQAKALDTYLELRGNAANQNGAINQETARRNLMTVAQAQTAALALGAEITPEDAQNLLKAVEGSGRAGDPTAVGKMFDAYIRGKQVFGSAIDSSKIRDYVQNAKGANFGIGEEQFFWQNIVRMTEGNASRLGNETAQTLQTLVGGHATKQTARWLVAMGLAKGFTPQGGGAATINGLSGSGLLQVNQLDWAVQELLPALRAHGVLSEANIKQREALLRKDNPNIDERALRERAEAGLISAAIARSGMRTTVTDNLAHAIANELLIGRDVAQMKGASGSAALAASIGQNPAAVMTEITNSLSNFAAVMADPMMPRAAAALHSFLLEIGAAQKQYTDFAKAHPDVAAATTATGSAAVAAGIGAIAWKVAAGVWNKIFGGGGGHGASASAAAGGEAAAGSGLGRIIAGVAGAASLPGFINLLTDDNRTPAAKANDAAILKGILGWFSGGAPGAPMQLPGAQPASSIGTVIEAYRAATLPGRDVHSPSGGPYAYYPPQSVSVSGAAQVDQNLHLSVDVAPGLRAVFDHLENPNFAVPLSGAADTGVMDGDARPRRGLGHV